MDSGEIFELVAKEGAKNNRTEFLDNLKRDIQKVKFVDLKFTDIPGMWQHFTVPIAELTEGSVQNGFGFDGSSIRGFKEIYESDILLVPDLKSAFIDPFS